MKYKNLIRLPIKWGLLTILFGASLALANIATAQTPTLTPEQRIEKRLAHAKKMLGLTDEQAAQLKTIFEQNQQQIMADRKALHDAVPGNGRKKDAAKQLQADQKGMMQKMGTVLTPEQRHKFKELMLKNIERRQDRLERRKQMLKKMK